MKDTLLFAEGFIGVAGSMISETAIGAVDLTQLIGITSIYGVNRLTSGRTPEWMKRDLQGTVDNLSSLAELWVGTYTALTDPGAAQHGQDTNASYADKAAYRAQETGKALWDKVTHMDAYDAGGLTFEIASLFVGPAAVGKMAKGTKLGAKAAEMISLAKNSTKARILANVEKWGSKVDRILANGDDVIKRFTKNLLKKELPFSIGSEVLAGVGIVGHQPTVGEVIQYFKDKARDVYSKLSSSRGGFSWTLRGENVEIPNISLKEIEYAKRAREEYQKLRREFDLTVRKEFLKDISKDNDKLRELGISESDIQKLADGLVTKGYQVHYQLPLDDSGTNSFENLVLIKNDPYHKVVTAYS